MTTTPTRHRATTTTPLRIPRQVTIGRLMDDAPPPPVPPPVPPSSLEVEIRREPRLAALVAAAVVVLLVLVGFAVRTVLSEPGGEAAPKELRPQLSAMLDARASLMAAEKAYAPVINAANKKIDKYTKAKRAVDVETSEIAAQNESRFASCRMSLYVSCPVLVYPELPRAFDATTQVRKLQAIAADLKTLRGEIGRIRPVALLAPAHAQLVDVIERLEAIAAGNASILAASVLPPAGDGPGYVNTAGLKKLAKNTTLTTVAQMDQTVISMLNSAGLPLSLYPAGPATI